MNPLLPEATAGEWGAVLRLAAWVQDRLGVRNLGALERLSHCDPAAAVVWCAVVTQDPARVRAVLDAAGPDAVCRRLATLCCATINPGRGRGREGRYFACRVWSQEEATLDDLAEAVVWCLEGVVDLASVEAVAKANAADRARWGQL